MKIKKKSENKSEYTLQIILHNKKNTMSCVYYMQIKNDTKFRGLALRDYISNIKAI